MSTGVRIGLLLSASIGLFIIGLWDLFSLSVGTCGAMGDALPVVCWGARLLRTITGWPLNVTAAIDNFLLAAISLVLAFLTKRDA